MKKSVLVVTLLAFVLFMQLAACGGQPAAQQSQPEATTPEVIHEDIQQEEEPEKVVMNRDWEAIETKFGELRYPDQWVDYLKTEQIEAENSVSVLFQAVIGDQVFDLFEIQIGSGEGEAHGQLTGTDGIVRDVFLRFYELGDMSGLSDGETNRVYAMQEALNYVLDNLQ